MALRYRQLSENVEDPLRLGGDMCFGRGGQNFLVDSPTAVAQAILTRLRLWTGEWFLDLTSGTPYLQQILGERRQPGAPDAAIRARIMGTPFVTRIEDYASAYNSTDRNFIVSAKIWTAFGQVTEAPEDAVMSPSGALVMSLGRRVVASYPRAEQGRLR